MKLKTVYNNILPFKGFVAMTVFPFVFVRNDKRDLYERPQIQRHEAIHGEQQKEMLLVFFYIWYVIEWLIKLVHYRNAKTADKNTGFEREAYKHSSDASYPDDRRHFAWFKYISV